MRTPSALSDRRRHYDVTNTVCVAEPDAVCAAVCELLQAQDRQADLSPVRRAFEGFVQLYAGTLPGYAGCDTPYHDAQHSLDCALAFARLYCGHELAEPERQLGMERGMLGIAIALFHDAGYVRRDTDAARNGAEYTLSHVARSAEYLRQHLADFGLGAHADLAAELVHFTGYEKPLDSIPVHAPRDRMLGFLVASADLLAQTSDACYLEKCRDFLYPEFRICGLAGPRRAGGPEPIYHSVEELLETTPRFHARVWDERLEGYFQGCHRYLSVFFGGANPYLEAIQAHQAHIRELARTGDYSTLRRRPRAIDREALLRLAG
ncbi:MAG: HD domain-containing protein [Gammaproteobacteria bacterium]|jgi:hypothetical protein